MLQSLRPTSTMACLCMCEGDMGRVINADHTHGTGMRYESNQSRFRFGIVVTILRFKTLDFFFSLSTWLRAPATTIAVVFDVTGGEESQLRFPFAQI